MIEEAIKIAGRSSMKRYGTGCVLAHGENILSNGWSHVGHRRLGSLYSLHAELHALARGRHLDLEGAVCYIATVSKKSGNYTTSKPCLRCAIALRAAGIEQIYFTMSPRDDPTGMASLPLEILLEDLKVYKAPNGSHLSHVSYQD